MIDLNLILKAIFAVIVYGGTAYMVSSFSEAMAWRREYERFKSEARRGECRRFESIKSLKEFERILMDLNLSRRYEWYRLPNNSHFVATQKRKKTDKK